MKILHWYHDIMNLYGDYANALALERVIKNSGENAEIIKKSLGDKVVLSDYDFVFIGSGTEKNQRVVLKEFFGYSDSLRDFIESGKPVLMTGNSFEMLGKSITDSSGEVYNGLGLFEFGTVEQNRTRNTADAVFEADFLDKPLVGFVNKCSEIFGIDKPLFTVKTGLGNNADSNGEGVRLNNLFGTHLTGPVLVKNPHFLKYVAGLVLGKEPDTSCLEFERRGYDITLAELILLSNKPL